MTGRRRRNQRPSRRTSAFRPLRALRPVLPELLPPLPPPCRLRHALEAGTEVVQAVCACALFHRLYPAAPGASPLRVLACLAAGNGALSLAAQGLTSALPLR